MKYDIQEQIDQLKIKLDSVTGREKIACIIDLIALKEKLLDILRDEILCDESLLEEILRDDMSKV